VLKSYDVKLDLENNLYSPMATLFEVSNEDLETVAIAFSITQDNKPFDLTGTTVELAIKKPSGLTVYQDCTITAAAAGTATTLLSTQAYVEYGIYTAEVYIRTADQIAVTCPFWYAAREGILTDDTQESINDWTALQEALMAYDKKPVLVEAIPDFVPEYIGQTALDTVGRRAFIAMGALATDWQVLGAAEGGGGLVAWGDILGKPTTFPPSAHTHTIAEITDFVAGVAANIPAEYLTQTEADARYQAAGTAPDLTGYLTEADAAATYQPIGMYLTEVPAEYLTQAEGDARYQAAGTAPDLTGYETTAHAAATYQPIGDYVTTTEADAAYLSQAEGDARYQQIGTDTPDDWAEITGKPATFPPSAHTHTSAQITDFAAAVAADIPAEYLTQTEADARYALRDAGGGTVTTTDWGYITGDISAQTDLQNALAAKADDTDLANYAPIDHTHTTADITDFAAGVAANIPAEYVTTTEADAAYQPIGNYQAAGDYLTTTDAAATYQPVGDYETTAHAAATYQPVGDYQAAGDYLTTTDAAATYQPKGDYLLSVGWADVQNKPTTFAPSAHTHASADITDFAAAVAAAIPAAYLTDTEANAAYQPKGTYLTAVTWTDVQNKPTTFAPSAHTHLWADITDKPTTFAPAAHTHAIADVTNLQSSLDAKAPLASPALTGTPTAPTAAAATNTTQIATTAFVQAQGFLKTLPIMSGTAVGGAMVGNGLAMSGNYLYVKQGASLGIAADNSLQVQTVNSTPSPIKFWTGNQATYDGLTKDANTLYFITG
jgi:hypothetical protein